MVTNLCFSLTLEPVFYDDNYPEFTLTIDDTLLVHDLLRHTNKFKFNVMLESGEHSIKLELLNKGPKDTKVDAKGLILADKAIRIQSIDIEGYELSDFMHRAVYHPLNRPSMVSNYLGWNGVWQLALTTPIFTWIHKTQNLGWIYNETTL